MHAGPGWGQDADPGVRDALFDQTPRFAKIQPVALPALIVRLPGPGGTVTGMSTQCGLPVRPAEEQFCAFVGDELLAPCRDLRAGQEPSGHLQGRPPVVQRRSRRRVELHLVARIAGNHQGRQTVERKRTGRSNETAQCSRVERHAVVQRMRLDVDVSACLQGGDLAPGESSVGAQVARGEFSR